MGIMNGLTFGGVNSLDYGIYISGEAVFNAPSRDVEAISVPGRNGDFLLDKGRFNNISVEYPSGTFGDDIDGFRTKLSEFRNAILSQKGYQRLTDTYHPDEYRMAVYAEGLEVEPVKYNSAGEFKLIFNCKPNRWLTSGETAVTVSDGGTITNPTPFDASPLLMVEGYGTIGFNGYSVEIDDVVMGEVLLAEQLKSYSIISFYLDTNRVNTGDRVTLNIKQFGNELVVVADSQPSSVTVSDSNNQFHTTYMDNSSISGRSVIDLTTQIATPILLTVGTNATIKNTVTCTANISGSNATLTYETNVYYYGATTHRVVIFTTNQTITINGSDISDAYDGVGVGRPLIELSSAIGNSSVPALGHPTYIDCDIGECYMIKDGSIVTLNSHIDLGSDLPALAPGTNTFDFDNTVTDLQIIPRWWKI